MPRSATEDARRKESVLRLSTASYVGVQVDFCFPIPDFRPEIEKNPWFARSLREERLFVNLKNCSFSTKSASERVKQKLMVEVVVWLREIEASQNCLCFVRQH